MKRVLIVTRDPVISFRQMPGGVDHTPDGEYQFLINETDAEVDFVVVVGKGLRVPTEFRVAPQNTILMTGEPHSILEYPKGYCSQFGLVCACQPEIKGANVVYTTPLLPWYVGVDFSQNSDNRFTMNYEDVERATPEKTKLISVISSDKAFSQGHVDRLRFIRMLKRQYGDSVDIFGRGYREFKDKWNVLAPYKYHIVIENSTTDYYFTEKLFDCYLAGAYPIYHGCRNIADYYPQEAMTCIDIRNVEESFRTIDRVVRSQEYEKKQAILTQCKQLSMTKYNLFQQIADACNRLDAKACKQPVTLQPAAHFFSLHNLWLYTVGRNYYKFKGCRYREQLK